MPVTITGNPVALCDTQHAGKEIVTRPMSEYFANDPECHDLLHCALRSHRVAGLGGCPTGPPVSGVTSTSTPAVWPCAVLWPCTFCSNRSGVFVSYRDLPNLLKATSTDALMA